MLIEIKAGQFRKVSRLVRRECCNCMDGNCLLLDDGETHLCAADFQVSHLLQSIQGRRTSSRQGAVSGADLRQRLQVLSKLWLTLLFPGSQQTLLRQMRRQNQAAEGSRTKAPST